MSGKCANLAAAKRQMAGFLEFQRSLSIENTVAGSTLQGGDCIDYYAIPVTQAVTLGFGQFDAKKGFVPFPVDHAGLNGLNIRIPQPNLTCSKCMPKLSLPSSSAGGQIGVSDNDFPALPSLESASALETELPSAFFERSMLWGDNDQFFHQNVFSSSYDHTDMPSSPLNAFSPWIPQVQSPFAVNAEHNSFSTDVQKPSIAGWNSGFESSSTGIGKQTNETDGILSTKKSVKRISCDQPDCNSTFRRQSDRIRHRDTVHRTGQAARPCPVAGCTKSRGKGFSRADKLTEHLWRKHADLGYKKAGV